MIRLFGNLQLVYPLKIKKSEDKKNQEPPEVSSNVIEARL